MMKCHGEFNDTQPGAEVPPGHGNRINGLGPKFLGELFQLGRRKFTQIGGNSNAVQQWCLYGAHKILIPQTLNPDAD